MKVIPCVQGSEQWHAARLGIPTASAFGKVVTPAGAPSKSAEGYLHQLVAERLLGHPIDGGETQWMERGKVTEHEARAFYALMRDANPMTVGFVTTDEGIAGCSPDFFVGEDGGGELKCPSAAVHVGYLLDVEPRKYWPQIQGALWITGRQWWDFCSYCPGLPPALTRYERDEDYIAALGRAVTTFAEHVDAAHRKLAALIGEEAA